MSRPERLYRIDQLLRSRRNIPRRELLEALEVSSATLTRDLEFLRSRLNAPIVFDAEMGGYRLDQSDPHAPIYALPGLWFNESELHALLAIEDMLEAIQPGLLAKHIAPLRKRLDALLGKGKYAAEEVRRRIILLPSNARRLKPEHFETCATAVLSRQRLWMKYYSRSTDSVTEREVSPQRLVRYKENWYLDAWCHLRQTIRSFSVDTIRSAKILETAAQEVLDAQLDEVLGAGYGIFAGKDIAWATLRFTARQARWVASEVWHPQQKSRFEADGSYLLEVPFSKPEELAMDILKYGPDVEVVAPQTLREQVAERLEQALGLYRG